MQYNTRHLIFKEKTVVVNVLSVSFCRLRAVSKVSFESQQFLLTINMHNTTFCGRRTCLQGPYNLTTATSMKTSLKNRLRMLSNHFAIFQREFMLELKRGGHARVQTEIVEYIALSSGPQKRLKIWSLHVVIVQGRQKQCTKKRDAYAELLFC